MSAEYPTGEAVARAFFDAWNASDADAIAALLTPDSDFVNVVGIWWTSARQIRKAHDYGFRRIFREARVRISELKVRELTPDIHIVHTVSTLDGQTGVDGAPSGQRIAVFSMVTTRLPDGFRIVSCQNTDRIPGAVTHVRDANGFCPATYEIRSPPRREMGRTGRNSSSEKRGLGKATREPVSCKTRR